MFLYSNRADGGPVRGVWHRPCSGRAESPAPAPGRIPLRLSMAPTSHSPEPPTIPGQFSKLLNASGLLDDSPRRVSHRNRLVFRLPEAIPSGSPWRLKVLRGDWLGCGPYRAATGSPRSVSRNLARALAVSLTVKRTMQQLGQPAPQTDRALCSRCEDQPHESNYHYQDTQKQDAGSHGRKPPAHRSTRQ